MSVTLHSYTKTEYKNAPDHKTTPINATSLNNSEDGIENAYTDIAAVYKQQQDDLTNISQTGSTASQAISARTYFYLNGTLVRAKTAIASGATFTLNTNYEVISEGALNKLVVLEASADAGGLTIPLPSGTIDQWSILSCYYFTATRAFPAVSINDNTYPAPYLHSTAGIAINAATNMPSSIIRIVLYKFG